MAGLHVETSTDCVSQVRIKFVSLACLSRLTEHSPTKPMVIVCSKKCHNMKSFYLVVPPYLGYYSLPCVSLMTHNYVHGKGKYGNAKAYISVLL